ncbi:MAG: NAD(P)-dependent oxidoreductase [Candidatus Omnitrophota bacterium]|nr:MAG: NAD(P)-dependent oxidoreductase [Candidatus Omnitrophota bacterium]
MKVLLTGVTGFIGSYFVSQWKNNPYEIIGIARRNVNPDLQIPVVYADLAEGVSLKEPVDVIVHAATQAYGPDVPAEAYIHSNVEGMQKLIQYARDFNVRKFIYLSSMSIYGKISGNVADENTPIVNPGIYGLSKYMGELLLRDEAGWLNSVVLRLPGILGKSAKICWLAKAAKKIKSGQEVWIYNPQSPFNATIHVADLERFISQLIVTEFSGFEIVTLGCRQPITIRETADSLKKYLNSTSRIRVKDAKKKCFIISTDKARRMKYNPRTVRETLRAYSKEC